MTREDELRRLERESLANGPQLPASLEEFHSMVQYYSDLDEGDKVLKSISDILNTFERSDLQSQMHDIMNKCGCKLWYGKAAIDHELDIMKKHNYKNLNSEQIITAPRRFGKSWAVAMWAVAVALSKKGVEISIFSTGSRASGSDTGMIGIIKKMLFGHCKIPKEMIESNNNEHIVIKFSETDIRKINAYPGSVHTYVSPSSPTNKKTSKLHHTHHIHHFIRCSSTNHFTHQSTILVIIRFTLSIQHIITKRP